MQMKWLLWRRLLSMHTRGNAKRRQEREKDRWERGLERGREREWGREKGKEKKPSNEWNLSRLFSSFCATIKQFTYIFEYSNILLTNYAEGITERKSGKREGGDTPHGVWLLPEFICTDEPETVLPAGDVRDEYIKHSIEKSLKWKLEWIILHCVQFVQRVLCLNWITTMATKSIRSIRMKPSMIIMYFKLILALDSSLGNKR